MPLSLTSRCCCRCCCRCRHHHRRCRRRRRDLFRYHLVLLPVAVYSTLTGAPGRGGRAQWKGTPKLQRFGRQRASFRYPRQTVCSEKPSIEHSSAGGRLLACLLACLLVCWVGWLLRSSVRQSVRQSVSSSISPSFVVLSQSVGRSVCLFVRPFVRLCERLLARPPAH